MKNNDDHHVERDHHLQQALKHAPDAELSAPPQLSARIIEAAQRAAAAQQPAPRGRPGGWTAWLHPRPGSWSRTGAFATVLMAVLLTVMWPAQTPGPSTDGETTVARAPVPAPAQETSKAAAPAALDSAGAVEGELANRHQAVAAPAAGPSQERRSRSEPATPSLPPPADDRSAAASTLPSAELPADSAGALRAVPAAPAAPDVAAATPAAEGAAAAPAPRAAAKAARSEITAHARADAMPAVNSTRSLQAGLAATAQSRLAAWLQRQPPDLAWRIDGAQPVAASLPWLQRLATSTGSRWRAVGTASALPGATTLQLLTRGGDAVGLLVLHADHVLWCDRTGACSVSLLTPEVMDTLQRELPR